MQKKLNLEQSICSARTFLNTFGLTLEDKQCINTSSQLKIFDSDNNIVGTLTFDNNNCYISVEYSNTILEANYEIPEMNILADNEDNDALFAIWTSDILFLLKNNNITATGELFIESIADSSFGNKCGCKPILKINFSDDSKLTLKILRDGKIFGLSISSNDYNETIDISPYGSGFIVHDITKGKYDSQKHGFPYRFYSGIFKDEKSLNKKLLVYLEESEYENYLDYIRTYVDKKSDNKDDWIQKGLLMQEIDDDMFKKIKKLQEVLRIGNISLFDNLIGICYDSYSNEEIEALLGIQRKTFLYQNGTYDLTSSYYDIDKNNPFNLSNKQNDFQKKLTPPKHTGNK